MKWIKNKITISILGMVISGAMVYMGVDPNTATVTGNQLSHALIDSATTIQEAKAAHE